MLFLAGVLEELVLTCPRSIGGVAAQHRGKFILSASASVKNTLWLQISQLSLFWCEPTQAFGPIISHSHSRPPKSHSF